VRHVTQDDSHLFCTREQIEDEVFGCLDFTAYLYELFGLDYRFELSTRPDNKLGTDEEWDFTEGALRTALERRGLEYELNAGDGAFYGPKIDLHMTDSLGRPWQMGTVQLDSQMPQRFGLTYVGPDNREHTPYVIHRASFGSLERFIGILIEHYAGALPLWLAPVQGVVLTITDRQDAFARTVESRLKAAGFRVTADLRNEKITYKIREHSLQKLPYQVILGDKELQTQQVAVRTRAGEDLGAMPLDAFIDRLDTEAASRP
jgi:threonyl-tRNA synthetase